MTPRPKVDSDPVATATMERIGRDFQERFQPPAKERRVGWDWVLGALIVGCFVGASWHPVATVPATVEPPQAVARERAAPRPVGELFNVMMPDGRAISSTIRPPVTARYALPGSGNSLGDARYVAGDGHWYIWTTPLAGGLAQWIDP